MNQPLGSRKRFIFRLVVYGLLPGIGLFVLVYSWGDTAGMMMGAMGVGVGLLAQYLLYARLEHPISAFQFALKPYYVVERVTTQALASNASSTSEGVLNEISYLTKNHYPDITIERRSTDSDFADAIVLGEEFVIFAVDSDDTTNTQAQIEELKETLETPLQNEKFFVVKLKEQNYSEI